MRKRTHGSNYKLHAAARNDLKDIGRYTLKNFGVIQRNHYLEGRFGLLGENPALGRPCDEVKAGYRCSHYGQHVVFYIVQKDYVEILAILHSSMLPERHL